MPQVKVGAVENLAVIVYKESAFCLFDALFVRAGICLYLILMDIVRKKGGSGALGFQ